MAAAPKVLLAFADKSEDLEAISISNPLRRAGVEVVIASIKDDDLVCVSARGIKITCDALLKDVASQEFDAVVLPGGMPGAQYMSECPLLIDVLKKQKEKGKCELSSFSPI